MRIDNILRGARIGLAVGALAGLVMVCLNVRFIDRIGDYILFILFPPVCVFAVLGMLLFRGRPGRPGKLFSILAVAASVLPPVISQFGDSFNKGDQWSPRLIVIGIDGATWRVMNPMIERGELENLANLAKEGASGVLLSERPMVSPALWTTLATGKPREDHGVYTFFDTQFDCRSLRFWEILGERKGWNYGVYRWMGTWPPTVKGAFEFPDWTARDFSTHPEYLEYLQRFFNDGIEGTDLDPLEEWRLGMRIIPRGMRLSMFKRLSFLDVRRLLRIGPADRERFLLSALLRGSLHGLVARELFERYRPEVAVFTVYTLDEVGHLFWSDSSRPASPEDVGGEKVEEAYRVVDETIGHILKGIGPGTQVAVVSDHGFQGMPRRGYFDVPDLEGVIGKMGVAEQLRGILIGNHLYLFGASGLEGEEEERALGIAIDKLGAFRMDDKPLFKAQVVRGGIEVSVRGGVVNRDLENPVCYFEEERFFCNEILKPFDVQGSHHIEGILLLRGPGVARGARIDDATQYDLTPTLLHLATAPVGEDMPGRVLTEALEQEWMDDNPVRYITGYPPREREDRLVDDNRDREGLNERLRALGYLK